MLNTQTVFEERTHRTPTTYYVDRRFVGERSAEQLVSDLVKVHSN